MNSDFVWYHTVGSLSSNKLTWLAGKSPFLDIFSTRYIFIHGGSSIVMFSLLVVYIYAYYIWEIF